ncbi:MAG: hypothetical protein IT385_27110 [Deltaproteobacteria bacterium]|nr:hypothetical protein [Deltaproteobacteria bacterium]
MILILTTTACWGEKDPCALWAGKLAKGQEAQAAVQQLRAGQCVSARPALLERLGDPGLGPDVLAALVALGRSPEAEAAVRRGLASHETVGVASAQVAAWGLASAEPELRAALADERLAQHHGELVRAALAIGPPDRWIDELVAEVVGAGAAIDPALDALAKVAWSDAPAEIRGRATDALAGAATRPDGPVTAAHMDKVLSLLAVAAPASPSGMPQVVERARAGGRLALLVLTALAHPEAAAIAADLRGRADVDRGARWLALALSRLGERPGLEVMSGAPLDADVLVGLALVVGSDAAPALAARRAEEKGAGRAALARAEAVVLDAGALDAWQAGLAREASVLLRGLAEEPAIVEVVGLTRRCGVEQGCLVSVLDALGPRLATLDADREATTKAIVEARAKADAATRDDAARAKERAAVTGDGVAEAKVELEAIRARTTAAFAEVEALTRTLDGLAALELQALVALARLDRSEASATAARRALDAAVGSACQTIRGWAVAVALGAGSPTGRERFELVVRAR